MANTNPTKPFTGNFQLQTKIRVIIQEVLAATIRKLSVFNEKIDKFEDYFMVYKEKVEGLEKGTADNKQALMVQYDQRMKIKKDIANQIIKAEEDKQKTHIQFEQQSNEIKQLSKTIKQIQRQNQTLSSQLSKTKGKFLQYSNVISALKQQVAWKITKYIEETAQTNTQIKINNEQMKKEYFNVMLMLEKQKEKYDKIIEMNQMNQNNTKRLFEDVERLEGFNRERFDENKRTLQKMDQYDTVIQAKLKALDNKCDLRITSLQNDNKKSMNAVKKLQTFNQQLQDIKEQIQKNRLQVIKRIDQTSKKTKDQAQVQILKLSKELLKIQKTLEKKLAQLKQTSQKSEQFLTQKIDFMKMEMENEISSHTSQLMQEKQNSNKVNSSTMEQVNQRINKFNLQVHKNISKVQGTIKEVRSQLRKQIQQITETIQTKIQSIESKPRKLSDDDSPGKKISPQLLKQIQQFALRLKSLEQRLAKKDEQIQTIHENEGKTEIFQKEMLKKIDAYFKQQQDDISGKVQKIMFLVTKMRGDGIVRSEFVEKEIKQIKKNHSEYKLYTDTILKLMPAFGQCINLILSLIYDAQYQHSKIIQDNLPLLKKDEQKFNTTLEGVLYEFKQKKKPGIICYRHKDVKKTQLVKATFNAYIRVWQELFENEFKNKGQYFPKGFYKKAVQKSFIKSGPEGKGQQQTGNMRPEKRQHSLSPNKESAFYQKLASSVGFTKQQRRQQTEDIQPSSQPQISQSTSLNKMASRQAAKSLRKIEEQQRIRQIKDTISSKQGQNSESALNGSFHIRKKRPVKKQEVIVVNIASPGEK